MKKMQIINWYPKWHGFKFKRTNPRTDINAGYYLMYKWFVLLGFWEIRKFMNKAEMAEALKLYHKSRNNT